MADKPLSTPTPAQWFDFANLPDLAGFRDECYGNIFCDRLHDVGSEHLISAVLSLSRVLSASGALFLTHLKDAGFPLGRLQLLLESARMRVVYTDPGTLIAEKAAIDMARGLDRVQAILAREAKTATYKLALIRALSVISRTQSNSVRWVGSQILVPLQLVALEWLFSYWPLLTGPSFVAQIRGEKEGEGKGVAFRSHLQLLRIQFTEAYELRVCADEDPSRLFPTLKVIANTIAKGPITFSGPRESPTFGYVPPQKDQGLGWIVVPDDVWLDITRFSHWIEDSLTLRWAQLTSKMNPAGGGVGHYLNDLLLPPVADRDTMEIRRLVGKSADLRCVWTDAPLARNYQVDHLIPYSVWGNNDLWNLLPSGNKENRAKSDRLPTLKLLRQREEAIVGYWQLYRKVAPFRFNAQIHRALGGHGNNWEKLAFAGLIENTERLATTQGLARWSGTA